MTLLTLCQDVADEVGIKQPSSIVSGTSQDQRQLLRLADRAGRMIMTAHDWERLVSEGSVTLVTSDQDYALPADFDKLVPESMWNRDASRPVVVPLTSREWQYYEGWNYISGLNLRARIKGGELVFQQTIDASLNGEVIYFDYISNAFCESSGGTGQSAFAADTDVTRMDEYLHSLCMVWLYKKAKGIPDWQFDYQLYKKELHNRIGADGSARAVRLGGVKAPFIGANVPDGSYG
jgi:hypothetical protein